MGQEQRVAQSHGATEWFEIERKYEVLESDELPLDYSEAGLESSDPVTHDLVASYYDTPTRALAEHRLALRHRIGGDDAGWHLKERGADGTRELSWPGSSEIPAGAIEVLSERIGDVVDRLSPTATLRITRTAVQLTDRSGRDVVQVVDDRVYSFDHIDDVERSWREWEAELSSGAEADVLDKVEPILLRAGAMRSLSAAKISRTLGKNLVFAEAHGASPRELASLAVTDVADRISAYDRFNEADVITLRNLARSVRD